MRITDAFLRRGAIYLHPYSRTTEGAWIAAPPFLRFEWDDRDLGGKLNEVVPQLLGESRQGVPHPTEWNVAEPLYRLAGVKSWREFVAGGCLCLRIEDREGRHSSCAPGESWCKGWVRRLRGADIVL